MKENNQIHQVTFGQEEDFYEPVREGNFWSNNYIKYENNGDKDKNLSVI